MKNANNIINIIEIIVECHEEEEGLSLDLITII